MILQWCSLWGHVAREGRADRCGGRPAGPATGAFGGAPYGATKRARGVPKFLLVGHANAATGASDGAPYGATKLARVCRNLRRGGVRRGHGGFRWSSLSGNEAREPCAVMVVWEACERSHWCPRWSSLWGRDTCDGCAETGGWGACERSHWGLRWGSLWGHEA